MKLRNLLFLVAAAPLASAVAMAVLLTREAFDQAERAEALNAAVEHGIVLSELVHELQRERGFSAGFVGSSGEVFGDELSAQRKAADKTLAPVLRLGGQDLAAFREHIAQLGDIRAEVSALGVKVPAVAAFYTHGIELLQNVIAHDIAFLMDPEAADAADFLLAILTAKEFAGLERAMGAVGFGAGRFPPAIESKFFQFAHSQNAVLQLATADVRADTRDQAAKHLNGSARQRVEELRDIVRGVEGAPAVTTIGGAAWFAASSAWVDELKAASDVVGGILTTSARAMARDANWGLTFAISLGAAALLMSATLIALIVWRIQREIASLSSEMQRVADEEDLEQGVDSAVATTELKTFVRMAETFRRQAIARLEASDRAASLNALEQRRSKALSHMADNLNAGLSAIARGDLACRIPEPFDDEFEEMRRNFNDSLENLNTLVRGVGDKTWSLEQGSRETKSAANDLARRAESARSSIESCGDASESLKTSIEDTAKSVNRASELAETNQQRASEGHQVVENAVDAMARIERSSSKISDIVNVIDDIALQTKLLALNASVEAARAGEVGRGFGVVATEVQVLAQRSSESAKDIREMITDSADAVATGVTLVRDTGACFAKITEDTSEISKLSSDIADAGEMQMRSVHSLADSISSVGRDILENATVAEELSGSAKSFSDASTELAASLRAFKTEEEAASAAAAA